MVWSWFGSIRSFANKVSLLITLTSSVAIFAVCFALVVADYFNLHQETLAGLQSQTMIVAMNSAAPLAFNDQRSATEALSAFQTRSAVASAVLYDVNEKLFAAYRRPDGLKSGSANPAGAPKTTHRIDVEEKGQRLGTLEVTYDLSELQNHLWRTVALTTLLSTIAVGLVYLFSLRIRGLLIKPIAMLSETALHVSQTKDYTQRVRKVSDDELGMFTDTFNEMLEQIQKQDRDLQASRAEALQANQLKDEFLATLSHELRTPMAPIVGWAQILRMTAGDEAKVLQAAAVIERNARAQNKIIDDLLDMSRIVSGKVTLDVGVVNLVDVIDRAIETVVPAATAKRITIEKDVLNDIIVCGDPHRLQQVLWNLLANAIKFTGLDGKVLVVTQRKSDHVQIAIRDTGQGIAADFLPHVFERFRQADSRNTRKHGGLGLGLAIVKQLVELHGGSVSASSEGEHHGSTFTVVLPVSPATARAGKSEEVNFGSLHSDLQDLPSLDGVSVLLVDDEQDARDLIERVLTLAGARVRSCASATAALSAIHAFRPDVLISDIAMPEASGYDLIQQVRFLLPSEHRNIPAIALTAFARPDDRDRALAAGFQRHLAKPADNVELILAVASLTSAASTTSVERERQNVFDFSEP